MSLLESDQTEGASATTSPPAEHQQSRSAELRAVNRADSLHGIREAFREIAKMRDLPYGIPMPCGEARLIVEPSYPFADIFKEVEGAEVPDDTLKVINKWYSHKTHSQVYILEQDGKRFALKWPQRKNVDMQLSTMAVSDVWGLEQESKALQLLGGMIRHVHFKRYLLTGIFLERSERSGVTYMFRKLRPTVAIVADPVTDQTRILACLCMHPIAYYDQTWAGAMCPTDDIIAHLALMRADEHMFWKRCNQHPAWAPQAGL